MKRKNRQLIKAYGKDIDDIGYALASLADDTDQLRISGELARAKIDDTAARLERLTALVNQLIAKLDDAG